MSSAAWPRAMTAIIAAARQMASDGGMAAVQIAAVAARAGIAAGTVYRYFPAKTDLVAALLAEIAESEISAVRRAAAGAPGPLSGLSAAIMTFAARALRDRRLVLRGHRRADRRRARRGTAWFSQIAARPNSPAGSKPRSPRAVCRSRMRRSPRPESPAC